MKTLLIKRKEDLKELEEIKNIIENNSSDFIKKIGLKNIDVVRILIRFFREHFKGGKEK